MRRDHILLIWIGGFVLALLLYLIGPDRFFDALWDITDTIDAFARNLVVELGVRTYGVVRALAIAIYVVFAVLAVLASQRGHRGMWALVVVTAACMVLIWRPFGIYPAPLSRWLTALILVVIGAVVMTRRLTAPPALPRGPVPPYPPGRPL
ncbi:MAG TPA: hypothetical protein DDZ81_02045 [Acetobacteraceae bacterium]|nr:hypothetical protein [Acetobacteraceae bacterium]